MLNKRVLRVVTLAFLAINCGSRHAPAATATAAFGVSVTVQSACIASASSMRFGTYNGAMVNATSTISVKCTHSTPYNIGLSEGMAPGATVSNRKMIGPGLALLGYTLNPPSSELRNWGHTIGVDTVSGIGNGSAQTFSVLGRIPAGQDVEDGAYADTITVTVSY
ncbi:MAG: spore coat U domain-containing protein [Terracidiphilus sp.]